MEIFEKISHRKHTENALEKSNFEDEGGYRSNKHDVGDGGVGGNPSIVVVAVRYPK